MICPNDIQFEDLEQVEMNDIREILYNEALEKIWLLEYDIKELKREIKDLSESRQRYKDRYEQILTRV